LTGYISLVNYPCLGFYFFLFTQLILVTFDESYNVDNTLCLIESLDLNFHLETGIW